MIPYIDIPFQFVAGSLGASVDEVKLLFCFLVAYPLAGLLKRIPDRKPWLKELFIIAVSIFYLVGVFDLWTGLRTLLISSVGAYAIAAFIEGPFMPWIGFSFLMVHMSFNHIRRQKIADPSVVDITGPQMVLIMKLSAFCWNVHDGRLREADITEAQKERALKRLPGLLDFAAYVLFFPSLFAGPAFDYVEYKRWIETTMFDLPPGVDPSKAPKTRKQRRIPRSGTPAAIRALFGLGWILLFLQLSKSFNQEYILSDAYLRHGFLKKLFITHLVMFTVRTKYYGVWSLTEGACILAGIGFKGVDPKTGRVNWNRLQNVKPFAIEFAQNSYDFVGNWNLNTSYWLKNYIYLRVTPKGKRPGFRASMATFITSAFWHGFYPGYYLTFALASFIQTIAKNARRLLRPFFLTPDGLKPTKYKPYYDIATWIVTQATFAFTATPFLLLTMSTSLKVWARLYFFVIFGVAISMAFLGSPGKAWLAQQLKRRQLPELKKVPSEKDRTQTLGVMDDPGKDFTEFTRHFANAQPAVVGKRAE